MVRADQLIKPACFMAASIFSAVDGFDRHQRRADDVLDLAELRQRIFEPRQDRPR